MSTGGERSISLSGASLSYYPGFFSESTAGRYFDRLKNRLNWRQLPIVLFGRHMLQPRLIAWHGDRGVSYSYSGNHFEASGWVQPLDQIRQVLVEQFGVSFNAVLCNRYRDGQDSMGWHSDDERELGSRPVIASVSLGATRRFRLRAKADKSQSMKLDLEDGSVLLMSGETQKNWQHCLPKSTAPCGERINLTFRCLQY